MPTTVRFLADEHVPRAVVRGLRLRGVDVVSVVEAGLRGSDDSSLLAFARAEGRVVFTQDEDFLRLHAQGLSHFGIVFASQGTPIGEMIRGLLLVAEILTTQDMANHIEFI